MQTFRELMNLLLSAQRTENWKKYCDEGWSSLEKIVFFVAYVLSEIFFVFFLNI